MTQLLAVGQYLQLQEIDAPCHILAYLGGGGQGEVYKINLAGHELALKWYFTHTATAEQRQKLQALVRLGAPTDRFLWPQLLAESSATPGYGYVMPLRPATYKHMSDYIRRRLNPTWQTLAITGYQLADSFFQLHAKGLSYRDISLGNVFFDPDGGDTLICDNDNVGIDGTSGDILGTPCFMAPEIVLGKAQPSTETDLYSLAVLLFHLFVIHHPLNGAQESAIRCLDAPAMRKLYGENPVFIFDPHDRTNAPVPALHQNAVIFWPIYPQFLRDLFIQTFTEGIREAQRRVRENQWRKAMLRLYDSIFLCSSCGLENFAGTTNTCIHCTSPLPTPRRLRLARDVEPVVAEGTHLYAYHLDDHRGLDRKTLNEPLAQVIRNPDNPKILGLKNRSPGRWAVTLTDGRLLQVEPGKAVTLNSGVRINFGGKEGVVIDG